MTGNWGRWGADDEIGALNLVDSAATLRAVTLVHQGVSVSLAQPLGPDTPVPPHRGAPQRFMNRDAGDYALGARSPGGFRFAEDTVQLSVHSGTHVDALAHAWSGETLYNGHPQAGTRSTRGAQRVGADKLRPIVTRGVLLDCTQGGGPLEASEPIGADRLAALSREAGVDIEPGDAVLVRTGWWESRGESTQYFADEPGITDDAAHWLAEHDVALVGADNYAVEVQEGASGFPVHLTLLHQHGIALLENLVLDYLAGRLRAESRSVFMFVFAPVPLVGSTAAPLNPLAVL